MRQSYLLALADGIFIAFRLVEVKLCRRGVGSDSLVRYARDKKAKKDLTDCFTLYIKGKQGYP
jgi:hypothetical protein